MGFHVWGLVCASGAFHWSSSCTDKDFRWTYLPANVREDFQGTAKSTIAGVTSWTGLSMILCAREGLSVRNLHFTCRPRAMSMTSGRLSCVCGVGRFQTTGLIAREEFSVCVRETFQNLSSHSKCFWLQRNRTAKETQT